MEATVSTININDTSFQAYLDQRIEQLKARVLDLLEDNPDVRGAYDALTQLTQRRHDADDQDIGWAWNLYRAEQPDASMGEKAKVQVLQSALETAPTTLGTEGDEFYHYDLGAVLRLAALMDQPY
jgi:hypothetical protein